MNKDIKLKPCPFCGGEAKSIYTPQSINYDTPSYHVYCRKCRVQTKSYSEVERCIKGEWKTLKTKGEPEAIKAWNRRERSADE